MGVVCPVFSLVENTVVGATVASAVASGSAGPAGAVAMARSAAKLQSPAMRASPAQVRTQAVADPAQALRLNQE